MKVRVQVTGLPGYDDFEGEVVRRFGAPGGVDVYLVKFEWEGEDEFVIVPHWLAKEL